jgi:hypothetical protein
MVSQRDGNVGAKLAQLFRRSGAGVLLQMKDGVFLGFRPQTLPADIRTHRREQAEAEICEDQKTENDSGKHPNDRKRGTHLWRRSWPLCSGHNEGPLVNPKFERLQGEQGLPQIGAARQYLTKPSEEPDAGHGTSTMTWSEHEIDGGADHVER